MRDSKKAWERMFQVLVAYRKAHRNCSVPTNSPEDGALGRWVATQRHRRKNGRLSAEQIQRLEKQGFLWSPCDCAWDRMFRALVAFRKKNGHCNVPSHWRENVNLSSWVANQRHRRKVGVLPAERVALLEGIKFTWAVYRCAPERRPESAPQKARVRPAAPPDKRPASEERLYNVAHGVYVQYGGKGSRPKELLRYMARHNGDFAPYIPLPTVVTKFLLESTVGRKPRPFVWRGKGKLSPEVIEYVCENGILPPHA